MSGPIHAMPVNDLRLTILELLQKGRQSEDAQMVHLSVSVLEYLKDAERWHYAEGHTLPALSGKELREFVDAEIADNRIDS